jgi:hypothetical protein
MRKKDFFNFQFFKAIKFIQLLRDQLEFSMLNWHKMMLKGRFSSRQENVDACLLMEIKL